MLLTYFKSPVNPIIHLNNNIICQSQNQDNYLNAKTHSIHMHLSRNTGFSQIKDIILEITINLFPKHIANLTPINEDTFKTINNKEINYKFNINKNSETKTAPFFISEFILIDETNITNSFILSKTKEFIFINNCKTLVNESGLNIKAHIKYNYNIIKYLINSNQIKYKMEFELQLNNNYCFDINVVDYLKNFVGKFRPEAEMYLNCKRPLDLNKPGVIMELKGHHDPDQFFINYDTQLFKEHITVANVYHIMEDQNKENMCETTMPSIVENVETINYMPIEDNNNVSESDINSGSDIIEPIIIEPNTQQLINENVKNIDAIDIRDLSSDVINITKNIGSIKDIDANYDNNTFVIKEAENIETGLIEDIETDVIKISEADLIKNSFPTVNENTKVDLNKNIVNQVGSRNKHVKTQKIIESQNEKTLQTNNLNKQIITNENQNQKHFQTKVINKKQSSFFKTGSGKALLIIFLLTIPMFHIPLCFKIYRLLKQTIK
ncbi:hypothetical protein CDIK_0290 [Cucumispora dikerogammari]|nr:hypothetical protein CDIK_0290 [Cucumispora dikerogammari]